MKTKLNCLLNELFEQGYSTGFCDATNKKIIREEEKTISEIKKLFENFMIVSEIEKTLVIGGLYMVLNKLQKDIYKESNSSKKVIEIHNSITVLKTLIGKFES